MAVPGQLASEYRSCRQLVRVLHQLGIPARATRLAAWRELARQAPPAVLADALGVSPGTAMRHAFLGGADIHPPRCGRFPRTPGLPAVSTATSASSFGRLHSWAQGERQPDREEVGRALADDGIVSVTGGSTSPFMNDPPGPVKPQWGPPRKGREAYEWGVPAIANYNATQWGRRGTT